MRRCPEALSFVPRNMGAVRIIMKMSPGYLEKADQFARMAALEKDACLSGARIGRDRQVRPVPFFLQLSQMS
jgi:hypothetical protein